MSETLPPPLLRLALAAVRLDKAYRDFIEQAVIRRLQEARGPPGSCTRSRWSAMLRGLAPCILVLWLMCSSIHDPRPPPTDSGGCCVASGSSPDRDV